LNALLGWWWADPIAGLVTAPILRKEEQDNCRIRRRKGTKELIQRACFDCHSNKTVWPGYSNIAPRSWLVQRDVNGGRRHLNFTEWDLPQRHAKDVAEQVKQGEMPPWFYLPMHPAAKLTGAEKQALIDGAEKSLGPQTKSERH
jgi:cytochrome c551/c552